MAERPLRGWLDEDVDQEKLAEGEAAIEEVAEKARKAAQTGAEREKAPPDLPDDPEAVEPLRGKRSLRQDPILPVLRVKRPAGASARLVGFVPRTQEQLPIFEGGDGPEASILDIVDRTGLPVMAKGRGAPLELRLAVQIPEAGGGGGVGPLGAPGDREDGGDGEAPRAPTARSRPRLRTQQVTGRV